MKKYPIVILPGWMLGSNRYKLLAEKFMQQGFKTYIIEFPGFENGTDLTRVFNLTDFVKHLNKFLKHNKIIKAVFICHSFGGRVALKLISQEPQKAYALILSGTPGFPGISKLRLHLTIVSAKVGKFISYIPPFIFFRNFIKKVFYRMNHSFDYEKARGLMRETFKNIVREHLIEYMNKIKTPTLLLWGEKDKLVSVRIAKKMQKTIVNSQLVIVPDKGHMFTYRDPDIVFERTMSFLKGL